MNIAIIPARGGSKRIPRKNIKTFCGKPMIARSIEAAQKSECFDRIIISTDDEEIAETARVLCTHGRTDHYSHGLVGWNSRIGSYESLFLNHSLKYIDARLESRLAAIQYYQDHLTGLPLKISRSSDRVNENGYCAVAMIEPALRAGLINSLQLANIGFGTIYPGAMSCQSGAAPFLKGKIDHGNADYISKAVLNLPCFAYITEPELAYVVKTVNSHFA